MNILLTSHSYPPYHIGGDAVYVKNMYELYKMMDNKPYVFFNPSTYFRKKGIKKETIKSKHYFFNEKSNLSVYYVHMFGNYSKIVKQFTNIISNNNIEFIHHNNISGLGNLFKITKVNQIYTAHDYWLICPKCNYTKNNEICNKRNCFYCTLKHKYPYPLFRLIKKNIETNDIPIIAPSEFMKKIFNKNEIKNVKVLHNFVLDPKKNIKKREDYKDYYLFVGNLSKLKGIDKLIDLFKNNTKEKLYIIGNGPLKQKIINFAKDNLNIRYFGWVDDDILKELYFNARAVIMPSQWAENCPLVILESYSYGTPVIGSDFGGIPELIEYLDKRLIFHNFKEIISKFEILNSFNKTEVFNIYKNNFSSNIYYKKILNILNAM